ncbi:hypothetical protein IW18_01195 [Flavobacterium hibernum]|uniref:Uncharacterized protein n=1 Tax=Flavobacterium hibernum TaxID=37752 RepID=A0A0D0ENJ3_9FLAO|nr:hypothetical protein IW18_01195 [Flavobacterium hibernum]
MPHCADAVAEHASAPAVINAEAVASEVGVHVVEIAVAAVKKAAVIVLGPEDIADGVEVPVFRPFDNRLSRGGRYAQCQRLHAAHGSGSGGVHAGEKDAFLGKAVQERGQVLPVSELGHKIRTEAFHEDKDHVAALQRRLDVLYAAVDRVACSGKGYRAVCQF